jgi:hypothetical protein
MSFTEETASRIEESTRTDCDVMMGGFLVLAPPCALHTNHHPAPGFPGQMHHETGAVFFHDGKGSCHPASL